MLAHRRSEYIHKRPLPAYQRLADMIYYLHYLSRYPALGTSLHVCTAKSLCIHKIDQSLSFPPEETLEPWLPIECPSKALIRLCRCAS